MAERARLFQHRAVGGPAGRSITYSTAKLVLLLSAQLPTLHASPLLRSTSTPFHTAEEDAPKDPKGASLWVYLSVALVLVLLGGAFAGLTIALMGQDEIYLQVIRTSGEENEKRHAAKVLGLLDKGKHWVLVTLLLSNVITNETLPIVLDRSLGGGWPAVLGSTVLIVIFGEILPQSVCVRYGLPIGAFMARLVLILMYILAPVAWPTAKLLDWLLGKDHGTTYKKAGLKTLVTLHKTLGAAGEQLNSDEVTIISAVLDLKEKPVGNIMTPMADVFTMSADTVLDEKTMDRILSAGYSRIPIHAPDNRANFVGMLLVKILITYDPEDCQRVRDFALATLPETRADTSCLDIVNFFQEGKSHMVLVSEFPGEDRGALGVVTLEDVIEELIGEEIIDESDVYIDVHKAIRRMQPAPRARVPKGEIVAEAPVPAEELKSSTPPPPEDGDPAATPTKARASSLTTPHSPKAQILRRFSGASNATDAVAPHRGSTAGATDANILEQLKRLGPSNLAARPKATRFNTVKIKPGSGGTAVVPDVASADRRHGTPSPRPAPRSRSPTRAIVSPTPAAADGGVGEGLLADAGHDAKDGVQALHIGYGTMEGPKSGHRSGPRTPPRSKGTQIEGGGAAIPEHAVLEFAAARNGASDGERSPLDEDTLDELPSRGSASRAKSREARPVDPVAGRGARSGSITENIIERGGVRKVVLETTSSSSSEDGAGKDKASARGLSPSGANGVDGAVDAAAPKDKKKRKRRKKRKEGGGTEGELLLGGD